MSHPTIRTLLISSCAVLPLLASTALAAPHRTPIKAEKAYSTTLQAMTGDRSVRTLDWRTPSVDLRFDLSQADIINDLAVTISADPLPGVDPSLPLVVQFNNGKPTEIKTNGRGFDATVKLDKSRVRGVGNVLRLSHAVPCGTKAGGYTVSLDESRIRLRARPKSRRLQLREVESRLSQSAFAPDTVGLVSSGPAATQLQALGAQAIGLRMKAVPDFRTTTAATDFDLVMVKRSELYKYTSEADILAGTGPRIELSREHPDRLFLTGDTDAEVLQTVQAFATSFLPRSRRSTTSPGEVLVQSPLDYARTTVDGTVRLDALSVTTGAMREYTFDVPDPAAAEGDLVLRLTRDVNTAPGAKLKAVLNGESLGETTLDGRRKTVSYPIRPDQLRGSDNRLELTTKAAGNADSCTGVQPFIAIGAGSKLRLSASTPSPATDLSRLAADGSVFGAGQGENTQVVLPKGGTDYNAALRVVAKLATASGRGWTQAGFHRGDAPDTSEHILSIEPFSQIESRLRDGAPRGLVSAWRGQPSDGDNRLASVERFASLDTEEAVRLAARRMRASGRVGAGGVAAIYPGRSGQLIGVISNTPGQAFTRSIAPLASDAHWNGMSGGVARWNDRAVVMAQTALPAPGVAPAPTAADRLSLRERFANLQLDEMRLPEFDMPTVDTDALFGWTEGAKARVSELFSRDVSNTPVAEGATFETPDHGPATAMMPAITPVVTPQSVSTPPRLAQAAPIPTIPKVVSPVTAVPSLKPTLTGPTAPKLRGSIELADVRHQTASKGRGVSRWLSSSLGEKRIAVRSKLRELEVKSNSLRTSLRNRTGLKPPTVSGYRLGGYEIPPAVLGLVLASILTVIGLFFVNSTSRSGNHH